MKDIYKFPIRYFVYYYLNEIPISLFENILSPLPFDSDPPIYTALPILLKNKNNHDLPILLPCINIIHPIHIKDKTSEDLFYQLLSSNSNKVSFLNYLKDKSIDENRFIEIEFLCIDITLLNKYNNYNQENQEKDFTTCKDKFLSILENKLLEYFKFAMKNSIYKEEEDKEDIKRNLRIHKFTDGGGDDDDDSNNNSNDRCQFLFYRIKDNSNNKVSFVKLYEIKKQI